MSLQHTSIHCNTHQHTATQFLSTHATATRINTLQHASTHCNTLQHTSTHCNTIHINWCHCNTHQHTATRFLSTSLWCHCNSHQHTATQFKLTDATATRIDTLQHDSYQRHYETLAIAFWTFSTVRERERDREIKREGVRKERARLPALSNQMSVWEWRCVSVEISLFCVNIGLFCVQGSFEKDYQHYQTRCPGRCPPRQRETVCVCSWDPATH